MSLDQIIIPGGGQNDLWHNLNCKGRYAGEIRIELTYYDTRPRDEKVEERRQSAPINGAMEPGSSGIGGPRQPKPVKRRPLPADPTNSAHSSPLSHTPLPNVPQQAAPQQRYVEKPSDYSFDSTPPPARRNQHFQDAQQYGSSQSNSLQHPVSFVGHTTLAQSSSQALPDQSALYGSSGHGDFRQESNDVFNQSPHSRQTDDPTSDFGDDYVDEWQQRPFTQPLQTSNGMVHSNSSPAIIDARPRQNAPLAQPHPRSSPPKSHTYDESPTSQYSRDDGYAAWPNPNSDAIEEYATPPPPPAHRHSGSRPPPQSQGRTSSEPYTPIPAPAPLNIRNGQASVGGSPLAQVHTNTSHPSYESISPIHSQSYSNPVPSVSSRTSYNQLSNPQSQSPVRDYGPMPPSLMPGYEPSIAEDESERIIYENRMSVRQQHTDHPLPQYHQAPSPVVQTVPQPLPQYQQAPAPVTQTRPQPTPRSVQNVQDRRAHRSSIPKVNPRAVSPERGDPRTPMRKSLSPQLDSAPAERPQSGTPFSPDSFDAFNPALGEASSINPSGSAYNTPEQAQEAYREHERQKKLGDGPIIGSDGRIIDPSDHLPTDTWAPEPEQKKPKKGPEVTIRFRQSPRGAQPMPPASRPPLSEARPHSISTPVYAHSPENGSPNSAGGNRLQKRPLGGSGQPASSPIVPTLNTTPRSSPLRPGASDYPLREHENFGGYGSSPTNARGSPGNIPPPVPGKVPINAGQEDWNTSALSEEMRRIDIGVGGRNRRSRYGL